MEGAIGKVARDVNAVELEDDQLPQMRVAQLREELRQRRLRVTGRKTELLARLSSALLLERERITDDQEEDEQVDDEDDEEDEDLDAEAAYALVENVHAGDRHKDGRVLNPANGGRRILCDDQDDSTYDERTHKTPEIHRRYESQRVLLTFKDVEESLEKFSGDNHLNVQRWLNDFEEMALLCGWNEVQKIVYAKRLLTGSAKLFVNYERCAKTWPMLKKALKEEFEEVVDSLQVHRELTKRRKRSDETYQEYTYNMLQIAAQANLDVRTVIQYIIEGIPDNVVYKTVLYGAIDIKQLKERFYQYDRMKQEISRNKIRLIDEKSDELRRTENQQRRISEVSTTDAARRCFNCGSSNHISNECPEKAKGKKCYKCSDFGHVASECKTKSKHVCLVSRSKKDPKEVIIKDCKVLAVVDKGSDLKSMKKSECERLQPPLLLNKQVCLKGSDINETMGSFRQTHNFKVNTLEETKVSDVSHIKEEHSREEFTKVIENDKPEAKRDVGIQAKIIFKDEKPVISLPRGLTPSENKEDKNIMTSFENSAQTMSDRETVFISKDLQDYCTSIKVKHSVIGTGVPRCDGQVENVRSTSIPVLTKLAPPTTEKWYGHMAPVRKLLNATPSCSKRKTKCQLKFGVKSLQQAWIQQFQVEREELQQAVRKQIVKVHEENSRGFNKNQNLATKYEERDLMAIQRMQFGPGLKLKGQNFGTLLDRSTADFNINRTLETMGIRIVTE